MGEIGAENESLGNHWVVGEDALGRRIILARKFGVRR
jgi:hypothetical protein